MTLGQRISQYRKGLGISQEELGGRLGVSRQAVSKWETDAAAPDMNNLMALAREFGVSVAELTETPEAPAPAPLEAAPGPEAAALSAISPARPRRFFWPVVCAVLAAALAAALLAVALKKPQPHTVVTDPGVPEPEMPETDFALVWANRDGRTEFLELGEQEGLFPFGTSLELTAPEEVLDTDFGAVKYHTAVCGAVTVEYDRIDEADLLWETITGLSTIASSVRTPRDIAPGSTQDDVLAAYGDELVYCLKEADSYSLVRHDYYYVFSDFVSDRTMSGYYAVLFFMENGKVAGISVEALGELGDWYAPDQVSRFPVVDGEPDFSQREEPEQEELSDTQRVYIAWNQLVTNNNLSAEEEYGYRRDVFSLLPDMDWGEFRAMGNAVQPDDTLFSFMWWLANQESYSSSEILWIQMGCAAKGLDGAYSESYCGILSSAFFYNPVTFAKALSTDGGDTEVKWSAMMGTAYDAELYPVELQTALDTLDAAMDSGAFTDAEAGWAQLLRLYLTTPIDSRSELPKTPAEMA